MLFTFKNVQVNRIQIKRCLNKLIFDLAQGSIGTAAAHQNNISKYVLEFLTCLLLVLRINFIFNYIIF